MTTALLSVLRQDEERILATLADGAAGLLVSAALAEAMDRFVVALSRNALTSVFGSNQAPFPLAIVVTGGQGRSERSPHSDLDLAIVHDAGGKDRPSLQRFCDALLYPLWDSKLDAGHSVRTVKETVTLFDRDPSALTSHLDARLLEGDRVLFAELRAASTQAFKKRGAAYVETLLDPIRDRARAQTLVFVLEPNLKSGPGGLRDIHQIDWALRFSESDALRARERQQLTAAKSFYLRARAFLHVIAKRRQDQITFELQRELAEKIYAHGSPKDAVEQLLGRHYKHAQAVIDTKHRLFLRIDENRRGVRAHKSVRGDGFVAAAGRIGIAERDHFTRHPRDMLRVFCVALTENMLLDDRTLDALAHDAPHIDALLNDPDTAALFWQIIDHPRGADALVDLHQCGVLGRYIAEFGRTRGMVQADFYHAFTVDVHSLHVVSLLYGLRRGEGPPEFCRLVQAEGSFRALAMGALFHDAGKRSGKDHAEFGAELVTQAMGRLSAPAHAIADAAFLVREHLTMTKISQRRDISDPELIAAFGERVGSVEQLDRLYVISYIDTHGTGPTLWTPWKGALLAELHGRTRAFLQAEAATYSRFAADELVQLAALEQAGGGVHLGAPTHGYRPLFVVARDRPGLLAVVAGLCANARLSIATAELQSSPSGWARDRFMIRYDAPLGLLPEEQRAQSEQRLARLCEALREALVGAVHTPVLPRPQTRHALAPDVRVTLGEATAQGQVIDVVAPDRPGLLYDLAETLFESGYSITVARVTTEGARAIDAFYVRPSAGDACHLEILVARLTVKAA